MDKVNTFPNLFIVGAAKSGTTSLHRYLDQHPEIFMCNPKEPHFLINQEIGTERIPSGICSRDLYLKLFSEGENKKYRGESSVMYLMYPEIVIPKIKQQFGEDCKIIILLRNPVERAYSGFQHVKRYNIKENCLDFKSAWNISEERYFFQTDMTPASRYKELGLYYKQVKAYLDGMNNVHIMLYDDYKTNFQIEMKKLFDFLEISEIEINSQQRHMVGGWEWRNNKIKYLMLKSNIIKSIFKFLIPIKTLRKKIWNKIQHMNMSKTSQISSEDLAMLKLFYKKDVQKLSALLKRNLNYWIK